MTFIVVCLVVAHLLGITATGSFDAQIPCRGPGHFRLRSGAASWRWGQRPGLVKYPLFDFSESPDRQDFRAPGAHRIRSWLPILSRCRCLAGVGSRNSRSPRTLRTRRPLLDF